MFENYKTILSNHIYKKKIAVIFSSKKIFIKKYGKIIDGHNHVIRLNDQKIKNYKKFVGSKTTIRFVNTSILLKYLKRIKKSHIKENIIFISPHYISQLKKKNYQKEFRQKIFFFDNSYFYYYLTFNFLFKPYILFNCIKILMFEKKKFSIGFLSILILLKLGLKPNIFGLDLNEKMSKRSHYYKNLKVGKHHNLMLEHKLLFELNKLEKIKIF